MAAADARLVSIISHLSAIVWTVDSGLKYTLLEGGGLGPLGVKPGELVGKSLEEVLGASDPRHAAIMHHRRALQGEELSYDFSVRNRGFRAFLAPDRDAQGTITGASGITFDITEQRKAEEGERRTQAMLRSIVETSHDCISIRELATGRYIFLSPSLPELTGYTPDEMTSLGHEAALGRIHPDDRDADLRYTQEVIAGKIMPAPVEYRFMTKSGGYCWFSDSQSLIRDDQGQPHSLLRISRDITVQKDHEEALKKSEEQLRAFVTTSSEVVYRMSPDRSEMRQLYGKNFISDTPEPNPDWMRKYIHPDDQDQVRSVISEAIRTKSTFELEHRVLRVDGSLGWTFARAIPILGPIGAIREWFGTPADITGRKEAEREIKALLAAITDQQQRLSSLVESITDEVWFANTSGKFALMRANRQLNLLGSITRHDIRNHLLVLTGYLGFAQKPGVAPERIQEYVRNAYERARAIGDQIQFTREYENIGSRRPRWLAVEKLIPWTNVPAEVKLDSEVHNLELFADPLLGKVFYNLLDNSLRHGQRVTAIRVGEKRGNGALSILWEDNGAGIPEEEKEKIFERGYGKNTGLGLFLTREILGLTRLSIRETGTPGEGARFEILAPAGSWRSVPDAGPAAGSPGPGRSP